MTQKLKPLVLVKGIALKVLPSGLIRLLRNAYYKYLRFRFRSPKLVAPIARNLEYRVQAGPFRGMIYPPETVRADLESPFLPKLLGSYELECHEFVEAICSRTYDLIVNIGAGEGFYAVGLARRLRRAKVISFESHALSREFCGVLARLNGVEDRIDIRGFCDAPSLAALLNSRRDERVVLVCDCEGTEVDLLRPDLMPSLADTDLLVELHDFVNPEISQTITRRFKATHELKMVRDRHRDPSTYPALSALKPELQAFLISEHRLRRTDWLFGTARSRRLQPAHLASRAARAQV